MAAFFAPLHLQRTPPGMWTSALDPEVFDHPGCVPQAQMAGLREQAIGYALSRHVPDMAQGFVVSASQGDWQVCGDLAARIASLVREALMDELAKTE